jgi:hypothetical protein
MDPMFQDPCAKYQPCHESTHASHADQNVPTGLTANSSRWEPPGSCLAEEGKFWEGALDEKRSTNPLQA